MSSRILLSSAPCRRIAVAAAIGVHICAFLALTHLRVAPGKDSAATLPLEVRWIEPARIEPPKPLTQVKPTPLPKKPIPRPPTVTPVQQQTPSVLATENPVPPSPLAPAPQPADPVAAPAQVAAPVATVQPAPVPAPITSPNFNADYLHNPAPRYPAMSRRLGETGRVILRVLVTPGGTAERVELRTSSGSKRLDEAALETVQRWKFVPARQGDTPVSAWVLIPILFTLES
jgi:protein TonB